jgi:hypothetical protein
VVAAPVVAAPVVVAPVVAAAPAEVTSPPAQAPASRSAALEPFAAAWDRVRAAASAKHLMLGRALDRSRPLSLMGTVLAIEVRTSDLMWGQLLDQAPRALEIVREVVGAEAASVELRFDRVKDAPAAAPAPAASHGHGGQAPAPGSGGKSVYDEPIVQTTQRILGSQQLGGGW